MEFQISLRFLAVPSSAFIFELFSVERKAIVRRYFGQSRTSLDGDMVAPHNIRQFNTKNGVGL